jgi:hypothetical protein
VRNINNNKKGDLKMTNMNEIQKRLIEDRRKNWKFIDVNTEEGKALSNFLELELPEDTKDLVFPIHVDELEELRVLGLNVPQWHELENKSSNKIAFSISYRIYIMNEEEFFEEVE